MDLAFLINVKLSEGFFHFTSALCISSGLLQSTHFSVKMQVPLHLKSFHLSQGRHRDFMMAHRHAKFQLQNYVGNFNNSYMRMRGVRSEANIYESAE